MASLQEWIHSIELGRGARIVTFVVALLAFIALAVLYDLRCFRNFHVPESMDMAQLARNIAQGKGYTTDVVRPFSAVLVHNQSGGTNLLKTGHPDLVHPPAYPALLAGYMKVVPFDYDMPKTPFRTYQPEVMIAIFNQILFFLSTVLLFTLAKRLFDLPVAWLSAIIYAGTDLFWRFSISGLSTMLLICIVLGLIWFLVLLDEAAEDEQSAGKVVRYSVAAGLMVGLACLTRYSFGWLLLPVLAFAAFLVQRHRTKAQVIIVATTLLVAAPWITRNFVISGTPFGLAGYNIYQQTPAFADNKLERALDPETNFRKFEFRDILRKLAVNTREAVEVRLPKLGGNWISAFFLVALVAPLASDKRILARLRLFLAGTLALFVVIQALARTKTGEAVHNEVDLDNLLVVFAPLVFAFGVGLFFMLLRQLQVLAFVGWPRVAAGVFAAIVCAPLIFTILPPKVLPHIYPPYHPPLIQQMSRWLKPHELMMSDMPWAVAWYGDRQCAWTTVDSDKDFYTFNDDFKTVNALYLSPLTIDSKFLYEVYRPMLKKENTWRVFAFQAFAKGEVPTGFPLKQSRPDLFPDHLFLADWARWSSGEPVTTGEIP